MMFDRTYFLEQFKNLLKIDSTTGQQSSIQDYVANEMQALGCKVSFCRKGGVIGELGGEGSPLVVAAHLDDIGLMVRHINADGTLNVCPVGGLYPFYCVTENVRVYTPHYGTDDDVSLVAGYDIRHAAIGPGTANSHGYERTHMDGLENTYRLLLAYLV